MKETIYLSTGCDLLDHVVGGAKDVKGIPCGKFINIVGDKSAGKTFLAVETIVAAYHKYGKKFRWNYDDCESGFSFNTQDTYGFSMIDSNTLSSETVEQAYCNINEFCNRLKSNEFGIYILDSLDGLTSDEQDEQATDRINAFKKGKSYDKGSYGMGKAKYLSREFFPQLCKLIESKNVLVIIISQVRENVDMFSFEKFSRAGGKAMDFYAHTVLWLASAKKMLKKDRAIGVCTKAKTTKSKTPRPYRDCFFTLIFDYGLDNIGTNIDFLYDLRTDKGELTASSKAVRWGNATKITVNNLKAWLKEGGYTDTFTDTYDKINIENVTDWIEQKGNEEIKNAFNTYFGNSMTREQLIEYIEQNELETELQNMVAQKWEEVESEIASNRKKKYATQPKGE